MTWPVNLSSWWNLMYSIIRVISNLRYISIVLSQLPWLVVEQVSSSSILSMGLTLKAVFDFRPTQFPREILCFHPQPFLYVPQLQVQVGEGGLQSSPFWWYFLKLKTHLGSETMKGVNQGFPPYKQVFWESWPCFWR